tara:strand:+ start:21302 stop:22666 length:1365 start_codon:yes stop_codon:yes gene_type:complete
MGFGDDIAALGRSGAESIQGALMGRNASLQPYQQGGMNMAGIAQGREQKFLEMYANKLVKQATQSNTISVSGQEVDYAGTYNTFPTLEESWNDYRQEAQRRGLQGNYAVFKELYNSVSGEHNNYMSAQLHGLTMSNVSTKNIRKSVQGNPDFQKHLIRLSHSNPELAAQIQEFMPQKTLQQMYHDNPTYYQGLAGAAGIGTMAGIGYLGATDPGAVASAKSIYGTKVAGLQSKFELKTAQQLVRDAKKGLNAAKTAGTGVAAAKAELKSASDILKEAKGKFKKAKGPADVKYKADRSRTRYKRVFGPEGKFGKWGAAGKMGAYMFGPMALQAGTTALTGSERAGQYAGGGGRAALSGTYASGYLQSIRAYVKKKGGANFLKLLAKKGGKKFALGMLAKGIVSGTGVGLAVTSGLLAHDLYNINKWIQEDMGMSARSGQRSLPTFDRYSDPGSGI